MATMRSPNYPQVGLGQAIQLAQQIWDREKRSYSPRSVVVQAWGYAGLNGAARIRLGALNRYGLLEENSAGDVRLSDLAVNILHNPLDSPDRLAALRSAALMPELFKELQQTYPHASDETIRSYLITKRGFSDTGADSCVESFRDTQKIATLEAMDATVIASQAQQPSPPQVATVPPPSSYTQQPNSNLPGTTVHPGSELMFRWPLARGVTAEVRFVGNAKPAHLDLLKKYLDVAKGAMEADDTPPEEEPE
jgi:hypothetical protein